MKNAAFTIKKNTFHYFSLLLCLITSPLATAQSDEERLQAGKTLYKETCARCHGKLIGRKITGSPKLTKLDEVTIAERLRSYAEDEGDYTEEKKYKQKMIDTAKALSKSDIENVAAYLATK